MQNEIQNSAFAPEHGKNTSYICIEKGKIPSKRPADTKNACKNGDLCQAQV